MSNYWNLHCKTCDVSSETEINHGEFILRSVPRYAAHCKAAIEADKSDMLQISIASYGTELIDFCNHHTGHELDLADEYGRFEPLEKSEEQPT